MLLLDYMHMLLWIAEALLKEKVKVDMFLLSEVHKW